jgi:hypothetical protein
LLGNRPDGFHLGLGGGRVSHHLDGLAQTIGDAGDPVSLGAQRTQQFRAGHLGYVTGLSVSAALVGVVAGLGGQAAALAPGRDLGVPRPSQYSVARSGPVAGAGMVAGIPRGGGGGISGGGHRGPPSCCGGPAELRVRDVAAVPGRGPAVAQPAFGMPTGLPVIAGGRRRAGARPPRL